MTRTAQTVANMCLELDFYSGALEATPGIEPGYTALQAVA